MKLLIAEDDPWSRLLLQRSVEHLGHTAVLADDGLAAFDLYQATGPDVIISDWMMPGIDGPELCRRVRQLERPGYTYFILLTALNGREHFLRGMQAGADDFLRKPLDREELQARLVSAERVTALHRQLAEKNAELERLNGVLAETARTDELTRVGNRLRLREDLDSLQGRVDRFQHTYCVALVDIDHFKAYNDGYGHLAGDRALRAVADALQAEGRSGETTYRYGGEEFLVLLCARSPDEAWQATERRRQAVQALALPHVASPAGVLTISAGVAQLGPMTSGSPEAVLREADSALYLAKAEGRNRVVVYGSRASSPVLRDLRVASSPTGRPARRHRSA